MLTVTEWRVFLQAWSDAALPLLVQTDPELRSEWVEMALAQDSLLFASADPLAIATVETQLAVTLPESYRRFLQASNGFVVPALDVDDALLLPIEDVLWLREGTPELVEAWSMNDDLEVPDALYFNYGPDQDVIHIRTPYLQTSLQLSEYVEAAVVLLNPNIQTSSGEWEAWDFGNAWPGAYRYPSFEALMQGLRDRTLANLRDALAYNQS